MRHWPGTYEVTGDTKTTYWIQCPRCLGSGGIQISTWFGNDTAEVPPKSTCGQCNGSGLIEVTKQ